LISGLERGGSDPLQHPRDREALRHEPCTPPSPLRTAGLCSGGTHGSVPDPEEKISTNRGIGARHWIVSGASGSAWSVCTRRSQAGRRSPEVHGVPRFGSDGGVIGSACVQARSGGFQSRVYSAIGFGYRLPATRRDSRAGARAPRTRAGNPLGARRLSPAWRVRVRRTTAGTQLTPSVGTFALVVERTRRGVGGLQFAALECSLWFAGREPAQPRLRTGDRLVDAAQQAHDRSDAGRTREPGVRRGPLSRRHC
jgi:hypothetical protein